MKKNNKGWFKKKHKTNLGRKRPDTSERMKGNQINKGRPSSRKGKEFWGIKQREEISRRQKGKHNSPNTEFKKGQTSGKKNSNWKGGITPINAKIRASTEYKEMIILVDFVIKLEEG
ncbi:hypothetical protein LCGC14_3156050 [marine sediment metagenome]|uniref:Nuclease associated modular domain-containing protein n=1 Tax=marine sediment metagenome TaxID=412755 RepID=A0A0F8WGT7_9ZZZZ